MSRFSARNFVAPQEADPVVSVKLVRGRFKSGRSSWSGDERGITLQTLIVTAVLVLMAVAAGVIIVAITDNSADDLEDQASDLDGRCQPWEIHDTELEAIGAGGGGDGKHLDDSSLVADDREPGEGGVTSSKVGCLAPCYLQANVNFAMRVDFPVLDDFVFDGGAELEFDTSNRAPAPPPDRSSTELRLGVTYERKPMAGSNQPDTFLGTRPENTERGRPRQTNIARYNFGFNTAIGAIGTHIPIFDDNSKLAVKVTTGQDGCIIFNTDTDDICLDSRKPIGEQKSPC